MKRFRRVVIILWMTAAGWSNAVFAGKVVGEISDKEQGLPISAASVEIAGFGFTVSSPDGFFSFGKVPAGNYRIIVSALGYKTDSLFFLVNDQLPSVLHILLTPITRALDTVSVMARIDRSLEIYGRRLEKASMQLMHVIARQSIEQSSDITVADMMQRVNGVSVLRGETGEAGKAIIRGMDPKYGYTTVNGMAIPSPDDRSRYLSLDLFPAAVIDHLEVYKTLTSEMAGDAIGGLINIVTRPVPNEKEFAVQLATSYSRIFLHRSYLAFDNRVVQNRSPYERYGPGYHANGGDFTKDNLFFYPEHPSPEIQANISWAQRSLSKKFGIMIAVGLQTIHSGSNGFLILQNNEPQIGNLPGITDFVKREYSSTSNRKNLYVALDYKINERNHLRLYQLYINKFDIESRDALDTSLSEGRSGPGTGRIAVMQRSRLHRQSIEHLNLQGDHRLGKQFRLDWSGVYSAAWGSYPDWAELTANTGRILGANGVVKQSPELLAPLKRGWLHNKETEGDIYANLHYKPGSLQQLEFSAGTLLQYRHRNNFYNSYVFTPAITGNNGQPFTTIYDAIWFNDNGPQNPLGTVNTAGTYTASENITSGYLQAELTTDNIKITAGLRQEHTVQHISSAADPGTQFARDIGIRYRDWLPSIHIRYPLTEKQDLKFSWFRAISRPSLYDVTFFNMDYEDYNVAGNPFLKRSTANNFDLRYELYAPGILNQLQLTAFYKVINNPYEKTLLSAGDELYPITENGLPYIPAGKLTEQLRNYGTANNYGIEFTIAKNFGRIGVTVNYTFTSSHIEQVKKYKQREDPLDPASGIITVTRFQQRSLQGQSKHLANLNLSYRLPRYGLTAQVMGVYTGRRINEISGWYELDNWQKGYAMLDLSLEKMIGTRWRFFAKATNLLNSGNRVYVNGNIMGIPEQAEKGKIIIENENSAGTYLVGFGYTIK